MFPSLLSFSFAVFFISVTSTKLLHLFLNVPDIPALVFVFCLPAFCVVDAVLICAVWLLLRRKNASWISFCGALAGVSISFITLAAAASQWGFFYTTGGQVRWADAKAYANKDTIKVLLSESTSALGFASAIVSVAFITKTMLYKFVASFVTSAESQITRVVHLVRTRFRQRFPSGLSTNKEELDDALLAAEEGESNDSESEDDGPRYYGLPPRIENAIRLGPFIWWLIISTSALILLCIILAFDSEWPYGEMMTTLPLPLLAIFASKPHECTWGKDTWPLPDLISRSKWEAPYGDFKGWAPGSDNDFVRRYRERIPPWLPRPVPPGFGRWDEELRLELLGSKKPAPVNETATLDDRCPETEEEPFYNPVSDPLRITNLDSDFLQPLRGALRSRSVNIRHVALIKLESTREELFPLQKGSDIYKFIMDSHRKEDRAEMDKLLAKLTPNAEKLTGKSGNFQSRLNRTTHEADGFAKPGFGGINVVGALTPSSVSTKSLAASHCGSWPLPVDSFEEADLQSYQPCIPQILNMFNQLKGPEAPRNFGESKWHPAFFASVVDDYDRQNQFEDKIGFKYYVNRKVIEEDEKRNSTGLEEINYFGYPETALAGYVRDYIGKVLSRRERMFLSHFTSTTHHPWGLPKWFDKEEYMGDVGAGRSSHAQFNDYLNTIRFVDSWLGQLMGILEETGIANETLVVLVGDHGQAFKEDFKKTGTYDNGHISNYRVPLALHHPALPRVQYEANATSISILPTLLDLLAHSGSLNPIDMAAASDLAHEYEGQSLLRPYRPSYNGRRAWNFGIVNPGGRLLTVTSADAPWRLVMPIGDKAEYVFTDVRKDPLELRRLSKWSVKSLSHAVAREHGRDAARWVEEAEAMGKWWTKSRKRLWRYRPK